MRRNLKALCLSIAGALCLCPALAAAPPSSPGAPTDTVELIVLLAAGPQVPTPESVIAGVNQGRSPFNLPAAPRDAKAALTFRIAKPSDDPDSPAARLQRYIVLSFPATANLEAVKRALRAHPWVLHVEENTVAKIAVSPSDPLFPATSNPTQYQWGSHVSKLPAAWDRIQGHAFVGLVDTGLEVNHPDLRPFHLAGSTLVYDGGNFRPHLSWDFFGNDANVDEADGRFGSSAGHGTHTSGIVAATPNNGIGVAGACWHCSLMMARSSFSKTNVGTSITWQVTNGAQIISMSFGWLATDSSLDFIRTALDLADQRDISLFASVGNDKTDIEFPASDPRVIAVGGIESDQSFWEEIVCPLAGMIECGSNYTVTPGTKMQELVAPAQKVLSTVYTGKDWNTTLGCGDSTDSNVGYGLCTGTSMSSPYAAAISGLTRSANPLLSKATVRTILLNNASRGGSWDSKLGYGIPDADASVQTALGKANGNVLANRLTPLFSLYSTGAEDFYYTTTPQMASAAIFDTTVPYQSTGPTISGYSQFPGTGCTGSPCRGPGASVFVFTSDHAPYAGASALVPLYRMSFRGTNSNGNTNHRDTTFAVQTSEILSFKQMGYELDGIEGYIHPVCTPAPGCIPAGAVPLYRRYHSQRGDFAIFPESELTSMNSQGYTATGGFTQIIGYVYPNVDSDGDRVVDGFETALLGTNPLSTDSDGDGLFDGDESLNFPYCDPLRSGCSGTAVWVSVKGNDANDCTRATPCRTFAGALAKVAPKGEIGVLDSGDFGPLTINKPVSLFAEKVIGGIQTGTGNAITINAGANDKVVLRGLRLDGLGTATHGISFVSGGSLSLENCNISNFSQYGVEFAPSSGSGKLFVTNTVLRNNGLGSSGGGLHLIATTGTGFIASIDRLRAEDNSVGVKAETLGLVTLRNSVAANNRYDGFSAASLSGPGLVRMALQGSLSVYNGGSGVLANGVAQITLDGVVVTGNPIGLSAISGGTIVSIGNNKVNGNTTDGLPTLTTPK